MPHRSPQVLAGVPEETDMENVSDDSWWSRFTDVNERGILGQEASNYIKFNEDYYIAKRPGEKLVAEEKASFVERYMREDRELSSNIVRHQHVETDGDEITFDPQELSGGNEPFVFEFANFENAEFFRMIRSGLNDGLEEIGQRRMDRNQRTNTESFEDIKFMISSKSQAIAESLLSRNNESCSRLPFPNFSAEQARNLPNDNLMNENQINYNGLRSCTSDMLQFEPINSITVDIVVDGVHGHSTAIETAGDRSVDQIRRKIEKLPYFCSIADLSAVFGFDELQHAAFCRMAIPLMFSFNPNIRNLAIKNLASGNGCSLSTEQERALKYISSPTIMYLGGEGGCGKSWVEYGIQKFAKKWKHKDSVELTGSTGAAAAAIGGKTIHSVIGYGRRKRRRLEDTTVRAIQRREASRAQQEDFSPIHALIVDEISMVGKALLSNIETGVSSLRSLSERGYFGSLPVMASTGDFFQLPPVFDEVVYKPLPLSISRTNPSSQHNQTRNRVSARPATSDQQHAYELWNIALNSCMFFRRKGELKDVQF